MTDTVVRIENLRKRFGQAEILRGVSFGLERGKVMALLGPSGSGKTTLLRSVAGLERPDTGRIDIAGGVVFDANAGVDVPAERRGLGMVFQSYAVWPHRSVFDNVAYGLRLRGTGRPEIERRVGDVLGRLGLREFAERLPHQLSGGQQQRVAVARALVYNPPLILLDEPLSNLDAKLREEARAWLRELILRENLSALYVTHDQVEAMAIADRVILLSDGAVEQEGAPETIYEQPATLFAAEFMGSNNRIEGVVREVGQERAVLAGNGFRLEGRLMGALAGGDPATALIRLERCRLCDGPGSHRVQVSTITSLYVGGQWEHMLGLGNIEIRVRGGQALPAGASAWVEFDPDHLWIF